MGLEGTRLGRESLDVTRRPSEEPAVEIPATVTDGRATVTSSLDLFETGGTVVPPDTSTRPTVGHPFFTCRYVGSDVAGSRPPEAGIPEAEPQGVIRAFEEELSRFESLPEDHTEEAAASLNQLECLAEQIEALSVGGLSDDGLRDRYIAVLRSWSLVRTATIRLSERMGRAPELALPELALNDTQITDRMREASARLVEVVTASSDRETVDDLERRLNNAIDNDEAEFLFALSPESVTNFQTTHEMAQALFEFAEEDTGEGRLTAYLESARCFSSLGLRDRASEVLEAARRYVDDLPEETSLLEGLFAVAGGYQEANLTENANWVFSWISFVGENSASAESRNMGILARAMRHMNEGEFTPAEEAIHLLPESETTRALLEGIHEGERRARVIQNLQLFQGYINLYVQTHSFGEGVSPEDVRAELMQALEGAAEAALSGEAPDLWEGLRDGTSTCPWVAHFLFDALYGRNLGAISEPRLNREEYQFRILRLADRYMDDSDYTAAGIVAEVFREDPELGRHSEEYFRRIEYHTARESLSRSGANFVGDWLTMTAMGLLESAGHFLSTMTLGAFGGGSIEEDLPGTAEFALLIVSLGLSVEAEALFSASRLARGLSPLARGAGSWAVREGTMAGLLTPGTLLIDAARRRSLEGLTVRNFAREFGANLVMFSLFHGSGRMTRGAAAPIRWGSGVSTFLVSDYANEGIGFRDARDAGFGERVLDSTFGDARVRFASWLGNRISGGRFERLREAIAQRNAEHAAAWRTRRSSDGRGRSVDISWMRGLLRYLPVPGVGMGGIGFTTGVGRTVPAEDVQLRAMETRAAAEADAEIGALRDRVEGLDSELSGLDVDATSRFLAEMDAWHARSAEIDPRIAVYRDWLAQVRGDVAALRGRLSGMETELRGAEARGDRARVASLRGGLLGEVSRRFEELSGDWSGNIDQARSRSRHRTTMDLFPLEAAVFQSQRIVGADEGVFWLDRPASLESGVEISVPNEAAGRLVIDRIAAQEGLTVELAENGGYRVTLEDGRGFDLRIRTGLDLPASRIREFEAWLDEQSREISDLGSDLRSYDPASLENLIDHLIARRWTQAEVEGLFTQCGFSAEDAAAVIGPRMPDAPEVRSGGGVP